MQNLQKLLRWGSADFLHIFTVEYPYGAGTNPKNIRFLNVWLRQGRLFWVISVHFLIFDAEISDICVTGML